MPAKFKRDPPCDAEKFCTWPLTVTVTGDVLAAAAAVSEDGRTSPCLRVEFRDSDGKLLSLSPDGAALGEAAAAAASKLPSQLSSESQLSSSYCSRLSKHEGRKGISALTVVKKAIFSLATRKKR